MKYFSLDPIWPKGLRATTDLASIGTKAYYQRRDQQDSREDILSFLSNSKDSDTGSPLSEAEIIVESISSIVCGSDTTSSTITNVADIVSRLPEGQEQLAIELDKAHPGQMPKGWVVDF